ncbi:tryptophan synthase subunit beta, partial [Corynebacterium diphtheriae]
SADGMFGQYGGAHLPPQLAGPMAEVARAYAEARQDPTFSADGMFGQYGGAHLPPQLAGPMAEVARAYAEA